MTTRSMSPEDLLKAPLPADGSKRGVDSPLRHHEGEGTVKGLRVGACIEDLLRLLELDLIDSDVLVTQRRCRRHCALLPVYMIPEIMYICRSGERPPRSGSLHLRARRDLGVEGAENRLALDRAGEDHAVRLDTHHLRPLEGGDDHDRLADESLGRVGL